MDALDENLPTPIGVPGSEDKKGNPKTLRELAEQVVLDQLAEAIDDCQSRANYCCGGSIRISGPTEASKHDTKHDSTGHPERLDPIALRWDDPKEGEMNLSNKIVFPYHNKNAEGPSPLHDLLAACAPATFGHDGKEILDECYRKAGKLDRERFSVNFHPHDYGILDAISKLLLPEIRISSADKRKNELWGIHAELYKLNASGSLRVSHNDHHRFFDWSNTDASALQWVAFYSDCEHEVLQVESGHRITLTYNLYVTGPVNEAVECLSVADPKLSPLYDGAKLILEQPGFMTDGGILGFYCEHRYAHNRQETTYLMPYILKGIDAIIFSTFLSLGLRVIARPVLIHEYLEMNQEFEDAFGDYLEAGGLEEERENFEDTWISNNTRVGRSFHKLHVDWNALPDDDPIQVKNYIARYWPWTNIGNVTWLNTTDNKKQDLALVRPTYGNEPSVACDYSHAAIFVFVPKRAERNMAS